MKIAKSLMILAAVVFFGAQSWAQDASAKPLQGWLDFLVPDASLNSVVNRIGLADKEKSVNYIAPDAQMYVWNDRFEDGTEKTRLELIAVPDYDPQGPRMMVIAIIDPRGPSGIYLPWARRYVDNIPYNNHVPRVTLASLLDW